MDFNIFTFNQANCSVEKWRVSVITSWSTNWFLEIVLRYSVSTEFDMSYELIIIISDLLTLPKENFFFLPYFYVHLKFLCIWKAVLFLIYIKAVL